MPELLVINPRHRRRKHAKKARRRTRRHAAANPHHRRRHVARRRHNPRRRFHHRRRVHRNPALGGGKLMQGVVFGVGAIGTDIAGQFVQKYIPASWGLDPNMSRIGAKVVAGVAAPMLARQFKLLPSSITGPWMIGGIVVTVLDIFDTYIKPNIPGLAEYQYGQVASYEQPPQLMGVGDSADLFDTGGPF